MWRYRRHLVRSMQLKRSLLFESSRTKHGEDSYILFDYESYKPVAEQTSCHVSSHWFVNRSPFDDSHFPKVLDETIREQKSFDDFGFLSSCKVNPSSAEMFTCTTPFMDHRMSYDTTSRTISTIPIMVDMWELGGLTECNELEQHKELLGERSYQSSVVYKEMASQLQNGGVLLGNNQSKCTEFPPVSYESSKNHSADPALQSPPDVSCPKRFDPDISRTYRSTAEEIIAAVHNQDISRLRSILTVKKWPDYRSIGAHLDNLFELVIRDSHDTDEAVLFFRDFAACNRRGFLHDLNGIRLAARVARDSGSLHAVNETLRMFRNMFLVRSPDTTKFSTPKWILEDFYKILCSIGQRDEIEELHKMMISHGFDKNSNIFIRTFTNHLLINNDFNSVFDNWKQLSSGCGTTCASDLIWKGIFASISDRRMQVDLAGDLLEHCKHYDHPSAIIANIIVVLIRLDQVDAARSIFTKVSIPGNFFKRPIQCIDHNENALKVIECFASLITDCMFAEKRRSRYSDTRKETSSSFLSNELLSKLDSFYGTVHLKHRNFHKKEGKPKLHRINDKQLFELCEFVQMLWMKKAETNNDTQAVDRLVSWSIENKLEIPSKINERSMKIRFISHSQIAVED